MLAEKGFYVKGDVLNPYTASDLAERAIKYKHFHTRRHESSLGGWSEYRAIDGVHVAAKFQELVDIYHHLRDVMSTELSREVILSPYEMSSINIKIYPPSSGSQGWHYDTQPLTCLLYLSEGSQTLIELEDGSLYGVDPKPGTLLVMEGRRMKHKVGVNGPAPRVTVPFNFYYPHDTYRPAYVDEAIYNNAVLEKS